MARNVRERMVRSATVLIRERGIAATALSDVIEHSGAPRGSIYHYFPGGKAQLVTEAIRYAGDTIARMMSSVAEEHDPATAVAKFVEFWQGVLADSDCRAGCPAAAGAVEGDESPDARVAARVAFGQWETVFARALERRGVPADRASGTATLTIAAIEGALILARAQGSAEPLRRVGHELVTLIRTLLGEFAK